ncbi:helix-turn-helix domain-containing protein [Candidatus Poriferisodalis sp.]|uniref:helix-turn-helix domain-containing protein n=1 Tax=Candidatus Poriferisodalis sp. TaxID=3101277 RepID=UPI003B51B0C5
MPDAARQMGLSRGTVAKWWHRCRCEGEAGLVERFSRPQRCRAASLALDSSAQRRLARPL